MTDLDGAELRAALTLFERHFMPEPNSGCWLWLSALDGAGYGKVRLSHPRRLLSAHRASWELHRGVIPNGLFVLHKCDERTCVNPDHLFLGTHADNMADRSAKGRVVGGGKFKLTYSRAQRLLSVCLTKTTAELQAEFRVQRETIQDYRHRARAALSRPKP